MKHLESGDEMNGNEGANAMTTKPDTATAFDTPWVLHHESGDEYAHITNNEGETIVIFNSRVHKTNPVYMNRIVSAVNAHDSAVEVARAWLKYHDPEVGDCRCEICGLARKVLAGGDGTE